MYLKKKIKLRKNSSFNWFTPFHVLIRPDVIWKNLSRPLYHVHFTVIHTNSRHNRQAHNGSQMENSDCGEWVRVINLHTVYTQIARITWPTWGPPGAWPQVGPTFTPWNLLSWYLSCTHNWGWFYPSDWGLAGLNCCPSIHFCMTCLSWSRPVLSMRIKRPIRLPFLLLCLVLRLDNSLATTPDA